LQAISKNSSHKLLDNGHPCTDGLMQRTLEKCLWSHKQQPQKVADV